MGLPLNTIAEAMIASAQASAQTTNVDIRGFELGMCVEPPCWIRGRGRGYFLDSASEKLQPDLDPALHACVLRGIA
jgi:hypothetical protein